MLAGSINSPNNENTITIPKNGIHKISPVKTGKNEKTRKYFFSALLRIVFEVNRLNKIPVVKVKIIIIRVVQSPFKPRLNCMYKNEITIQIVSPAKCVFFIITDETSFSLL